MLQTTRARTRYLRYHYMRLSRPRAWPSAHPSFSWAPPRRGLATLPDPRTPTGSIIIRPSPQTAIDAPRLVPPPVPGDGPLLERRADRELPKYVPGWMPWAKTFPLFVILITVASLGIFNYQKSSSSVVSSILYALRTNDKVREALGGEIYFRDRVPWIWGKLNQLQGIIDIGFGVKGKQGSGFVRFKSRRKDRMGFYETSEWSLELEDGTLLQLLEQESKNPLLSTREVPQVDPRLDDAGVRQTQSIA